MGISEKKMQIVINNYFKQECDVNTSIREAFEKGFRIGVKKTSSAEQDWIPCSERMPYAEDGNSGILLVTCGYKNVEDTSIRWLRRLWFDGEYWNDVDGERYNQIVYAWMPLPKPYKGETDDR